MLWALVWTAGGPAPALAGGGLAAIDAFQVARHHLANGHREKALASFNEALRLNPQFVQAYVGRGKLLAEMGQYSSALSDLNFALHLQPTHAEGFAYRGFALLGMGRAQEALPDLDTALRLDPSYARVHYLRGQTLKMMGRANDAEVSLAAALELDPTIEVVQVVTATFDPETNIGAVQLAGPSALDRTSIMPSTVVTPPPADPKREGNLASFGRHPILSKLEPPAVSRPGYGSHAGGFGGPFASAAGAIRPLQRAPIQRSGHDLNLGRKLIREGEPTAEQLSPIPQNTGAAAAQARPAPTSPDAAATAVAAIPQSANQPVEPIGEQAAESPMVAEVPVIAEAPVVAEPPVVAEVPKIQMVVEPTVVPEAAPLPAVEVPFPPEELVKPAAEPFAAAASPNVEAAPPSPVADAASIAVESPMPAFEPVPVFIADEPPAAPEQQPTVREIFARVPNTEPMIAADDQTPASSLVIASPMSAGIMPSRSAEDAADRLTAALESTRTAAAERVGPPVATDAPVDELPTMIVTDQPIAEFAKDPGVANPSPAAGGEPGGSPAFAATLAELDAAVGAEPGNPELRRRRAALRLEHDQPLAAVADFNEALKLEPARIDGYLGRAKAYQQAGRFVDAVEDYSIVLQLDDHHAIALIERGRCLALLGQAADAERDRAAALALDPSLAKTGPKYGAAFASDVRQARSLPVTQTAFGNLFGETTAGGPVTTTESAVQEAVFVSDDAAPQNAAVFAFASDDAPAEAEFRSLSDEIAKTPGQAPLHIRRACAALALGMAAEAVTDLTVALELDPACGEALTLRSRAYAALGRIAEADADQLRAADLMMMPK
jgi:tetratricopeptide (TPR) repeat protein